MNVLLLGGTGSTGTALIQCLRTLRPDVAVTVISRTAREVAGAQRVVTGHYAEIIPMAGFRGDLAGLDAIVHLADGLSALQSGPLASDTAEADRLIANTGNVARAAREARVPSFIHVSSIKAICGEDDDRVLTETCEPTPTTLYGRSKLALERQLQEVFNGSATRLVMLRNPVMYAKGKAGSIQRLVELADTPLPLPLAGVNNKRSLIAVRNFANALATATLAGSNGPAGVFHVHDGPPLSTTELVATLRRSLGRPERLFPIGSSVARAVCRMPFAGPTARRLFGSLQLDDALFREQFGWRPETDTRSELAVVAAQHASRLQH